MTEEKKNELLLLLKQKGVYSKISDITLDELIIWMKNGSPNSLDLNCPVCKEYKTFVKDKADDSKFLGTDFCSCGDGGYRYYGRMIQFIYKCPTCGEQLFFAFLHDEDKAIKIAQYPSVFDVSRDELKKYQKNDLIDKASFSEINKADICASENYYVAAYTYMRRVYESMLMKVFAQHEDEIGITEDEYRKLRSDEKMEKIKPFLAIDDEVYKPLYSLLSVGIHSLTEAECCEDYDLLKSILLDILAEQKAKKEKESKRKQIQDLYARKKANQNK